MRCVRHQEADAIALCRVCSVALCKECLLPCGRGYACSPECVERAGVLDRMIDLQKANLKAGMYRRWFGASAFLLVLGILLAGEHALFGAPLSAPRILFGAFSLLLGISGALHVLFIKARSGA
jgi:hypothetical protein